MTQPDNDSTPKYNLEITEHAARVLAGDRDIPAPGNEIVLGGMRLQMKNVAGKLFLVDYIYPVDQWPEIFNLDSKTGLPLSDYQAGTSIPVIKSQGDPVSYENAFFDPGNRTSPKMFETSVQPEKYRGYLIYHRVDSGLPVESGTHVFDVVRPDPEPLPRRPEGVTPAVGVCVMQMAGPSGARVAIDKLINGLHYSQQLGRIKRSAKP